MENNKISKTRIFLEVRNKELAYLVRLYCFFKQKNAKDWLEEVLHKEIEPFRIWLKTQERN